MELFEKCFLPVCKVGWNLDNYSHMKITSSSTAIAWKSLTLYFQDSISRSTLRNLYFFGPFERWYTDIGSKCKVCKLYIKIVKQVPLFKPFKLGMRFNMQSDYKVSEIGRAHV